MKIKSLGWSSFLLSTGDITVLTDPLALKQSGLAFPKVKQMLFFSLQKI